MTERRSSERREAAFRVVFVLPGEHAPWVCTGRTIDVGAGGCTVELDDSVPDDLRDIGGTLVVSTPAGEIPMLTAPLLSGAGRGGRVVGVGFIASIDRNPAWADLLEAVPDPAAP